MEDSYYRNIQGHSLINTVEYDLHSDSPFLSFLDHNDNVSCAACHVSTRSAVLMIPAWHHCPGGWTVEYTGYLMSEHYTHGKVTYMNVFMYVNAESIPGSYVYMHAHTDKVCSTMLKLPVMDYHVHHMEGLTFAVYTK